MDYKSKEIERLGRESRALVDFAKKRENILLLIAQAVGLEEEEAKKALFEPDYFSSLCISAILDLRCGNEELLKTVKMLQKKLVGNNKELLSFMRVWGKR